MYAAGVAWLRQYPKGIELPQLCALCFGGYFLWSSLAMLIFTENGITDEQLVAPEMRAAFQALSQESFATWWRTMLGVAFTEELLFRLIPLFPIVFAMARWPALILALPPAVLASAVVFGFWHGIGLWYNLLLQGVLGLMLAVVFLKCCGLDYNRVARGFGAAWGLHTVWNIYALAHNTLHGIL